MDEVKHGVRVYSSRLLATHMRKLVLSMPYILLYCQGQHQIWLSTIRICALPEYIRSIVNKVLALMYFVTVRYQPVLQISLTISSLALGPSYCFPCVSEATLNRKCQGYLYIKWEHQSTMQKIRHYLRHGNKVNENKVLSYHEASRYMQKQSKQWKSCSPLCQSYKSPSFQTRFPKDGPTYRRQVV